MHANRKGHGIQKTVINKSNNTLTYSLKSIKDKNINVCTVPFSLKHIQRCQWDIVRAHPLPNTPVTSSLVFFTWKGRAFPLENWNTLMKEQSQ